MIDASVIQLGTEKLGCRMSVRDYLVCDGCGASVPLHDDCKGWSHLEVYDGGRGMELHFCPVCTDRIIADCKEEGE